VKAIMGHKKSVCCLWFVEEKAKEKTLHKFLFPFHFGIALTGLLPSTLEDSLSRRSDLCTCILHLQAIFFNKFLFS